MKQFYFFFFSFFLLFHESVASSRFYTLLKQYQNYALRSEHQSLSFLFQSLTLPYKPSYTVPASYDTSHYDTISYRGTYIHGQAAYLNQKKNEATYHKILKKKSVELLGSITTDGYTVESTVNSSQLLDTSELRLSLKGDYVYSLERYLQNETIKFPLFFTLSPTISGTVYFLHEKNFEPGIENKLPSQFKNNRYIKNKQAFTVLTDFDIGFGAGKQLNVAPLYQTFKFEKTLLKSNLINFKLSDETLLSIAELVAKDSGYENRKHNKIKKMKEKIDSVLIKDVAVEPRNLRNISLLEIQKLLFSKVQEILFKPQCRIFSISRLLCDVSNTNINYPYGTNDISLEFSSTTTNTTSFTIKGNKPFMLKYEHLIGLEADFNIIVSPYWFLNIHAYRNLVSTDKNINFTHRHTHINWSELLDIRWNFNISTWPTNWFFAQIGVMNLPSWILVPRKMPYKVVTEIGFYIENNILIKPSVLFFNDKYTHDSYSKWFDTDNVISRGLLFRISASYYF